MRKEETDNRMRRIYARKRLATNPVSRSKFAQLIEELRGLTGSPAHEEGWSVLGDAMMLAIDIEAPETALMTSQADRLKRAVRDISDVKGLRTEDVMRAIGLQWFNSNGGNDVHDPIESSIAEQLEQAELFDRSFPPTVAWHEALIDALNNVEGLTAENRQFLIQQHLDAIADIRAAKKADDDNA